MIKARKPVAFIYFLGVKRRVIMCKHSGVKTKYTHAITLRLFVF